MKHIISCTISVFFTCAMFSCGKSTNPKSANANQNPVVIPHKEIESTDSHSQQSAPPIDILDSQVRINDNYELQIFAANNWYKFKTALPKVDLTEQEFEMRTTSNLNARLKCLDARCSKSEISVLSRSSQHQLYIEQLKVIPVGGEFLKNCELPLFFDYEFDELIGDNPQLKTELKKYAAIDQLEITASRVGTVRENNEQVNVNERLHFRFLSGNKTLFAADSSAVESQNISLLVTKPRSRYLKKVSVNSVGSRSRRSFDWVRFHFPLNGKNETCYHMSVIPKVL